MSQTTKREQKDEIKQAIAENPHWEYVSSKKVERKVDMRPNVIGLRLKEIAAESDFLEAYRPDTVNRKVYRVNRGDDE